MPNDPKTLLRGLAKLVAVVVVAGLVGAGLGIALAKLSGNDGGGTPALPATTTPAASAPSTTPATTAAATTAATATDDTPARIEILSALLGPASQSTGRALVAAKLRVTNRGGRPLVIGAPVLLSGTDAVQLNGSADGAPNPLIGTLAPAASASGTLRFALTAEITGRLNAAAKPGARLRIAKRTVVLKLEKG